MNPAVKQIWVDALRSGRYRQIRNSLSDTTNGRCCLGVLCDLAVEAGVVEKRIDVWRWPVYKSLVIADIWDSNAALLPAAVVSWAGLPNNDPRVDPNDPTSGLLTTLNDNAVPFTVIADLIERNH